MINSPLFAAVAILLVAAVYLRIRRKEVSLPGPGVKRVQTILSLSRNTKQALKVGLDIVLLPFCLWLAFSLRLGTVWHPMVVEFAWLFPWTIILAIPLFVRAGMYRAMIRYVGPHSIIAMAEAITLHVALLAAALVVGGGEEFPLTILAIYWLLCLLLVAGSRMFVRAYLRYAIKVTSFSGDLRSRSARR